MKSKKKSFTKRKMISISIGVILLFLLIGVIRYLTFSLPADTEALGAMVSNEKVKVEEVGNTIVFTPLNNTPTIGYIYYPGGQVEPESFAYAGRKIAESGIMVVIQKMPFNLAIFGKDKALSVINNYPDIEKWYIGGFSLGGVSASMLASSHPEKFDGVVLYASYTTKSYSLKDSGLKVLSLSGSNDGLASVEKIDNAKQYLPESTTTYIQIPGGNHTQMAMYGNGALQKGDNEAKISRIKQQELLINETINFISQEEKVID